VLGRVRDLVASPFKGIEWSLSYIAFIVYVFATTSFRLPLGTASVAMIAAIVTLPLERTRIRFPSAIVFAAGLAAWAFIGWTTTEYPALVYDKISEFSKIIAIAFVGVNVLTTRQRLRFFLIALLATFLAYPVRGTLITYAAGSTMAGRATWNYTYSNPNDLATLCLLQLALALGVLQVERQRMVRLLAWAGVILLPIVIILTQSRGALIALGALAVLLGRKYWRHGKAILGAAAIAGLIYMVAPDSAWQRFSTLKETSQDKVDRNRSMAEGSTVQRLEIWKVARTIVAENPITGVGMGAYPQAHFKYSQRTQFDPIALGKRDTHSTYLNLMAETGIPGFLLFAGILIATLRGAHRARRQSAGRFPDLAAQLFYLEVGLYGFLVAGIWGSYGELAPTYLYIAILCAVTMVMTHDVAGQRLLPRGAMLASSRRAAPVQGTRRVLR
jgi:probable O-glycosylation ligase (exosortase A-associated)